MSEEEDHFEIPPDYPGINVEPDSEIEKFLITFCLRNNLYLNICHKCERCNGAVGDSAVIKKMIVPIRPKGGEDWPGDDLFIRLSAYLNQIKQDYVTARFLLALSRYKKFSLDFVDKRVKIINTLDYSVHNIHIELVKASFKSFYGVLDKVAYFLDEYLNLKTPGKNRSLSFQTIWYENRRSKTKKVRRQIQDTENYSLNAIFDVHKDFQRGQCQNLQNIRNALTHRFIKVGPFNEAWNEESISESSFGGSDVGTGKNNEKCYSLLYSSLHIEEVKKERKSTGFIAPIIYEDIPDDLK